MTIVTLKNVTMGLTMVKTDFVEWLDERLNERGWTRAELAKRANISEASLSLLYSGARKPGMKMCQGIAAALKLSPDDVYRAAGLLDAKPSDDEVVSEIAHISHSLNENNRQDLLDYARLRLQKQEKEQSGKRTDKRTKMLE